MPQHSQLAPPQIEEPGAHWLDAMMEAIARCAPTVVRVFARLDASLPQGPDREVLAGRIILQAAQAACREAWPDADLETRTEAIAMECIANELDGVRSPLTLGLGDQAQRQG